jgi:hypothetical protein
MRYTVPICTVPCRFHAAAHEPVMRPAHGRFPDVSSKSGFPRNNLSLPCVNDMTAPAIHISRVCIAPVHGYAVARATYKCRVPHMIARHMPTYRCQPCRCDRSHMLARSHAWPHMPACKPALPCSHRQPSTPWCAILCRSCPMPFRSIAREGTGRFMAALSTSLTYPEKPLITAS